MYVARVLYPVEVLGPGRRVGIWFCGCSRRCKGCSNPELWEFDERFKTTEETVFELIRLIAKDNQIDGFTITGGEPMQQPESLRCLIGYLKTISTDILVYTGYSIDQLPTSFLDGIAVLIDGEYIEKRNSECFLRGSDNQTIHILNAEYEPKYRDYLENGANRIQNFTTSDGIVSVGIHKPDFISDLESKANAKGLDEA